MLGAWCLGSPWLFHQLAGKEGGASLQRTHYILFFVEEASPVGMEGITGSVFDSG